MVFVPMFLNRPKIILLDSISYLSVFFVCFACVFQQQRRHEYYEWAKKVVDNLRGTNESIENALDAIFRRQGVL